MSPEFSQRLFALILLGLASALPAAAAASDCDAADPVLTYTSTPPLLAPQASSSLVVTLYADGCTSATFPNHDLRAGVHVARLDPASFSKLLTEIEASELRQLNAANLAARLSEERMLSKQAGGSVHAVRDENIVSLVFHGPKGALSDHELRWASLRQDLLYAPKDSELLALDSMLRRLEQLAADIHAESEQRR